MSTPHAAHLRTCRVLSVDDDACRVWDGEVVSVRFSPTFPNPRVDRVAPGHLVAIASVPNFADVVIWRWYDAVVLGSTDDGSVRLWEPAHGEVVATARPTYVAQEPGSRAYASAGLPGADWWAACNASDALGVGNIDLAEASALYTVNDLWAGAFDLPV